MRGRALTVCAAILAASLWGCTGTSWTDPAVAEKQARATFARYRRAILKEEPEALFDLLSTATQAEAIRDYGDRAEAVALLGKWILFWKLPAQKSHVLYVHPPSEQEPVVDLQYATIRGRKEWIRMVREEDDWRIVMEWEDIRQTVGR